MSGFFAFLGSLGIFVKCLLFLFLDSCALCFVLLFEFCLCELFVYKNKSVMTVGDEEEGRKADNNRGCNEY